MKIELDLPDNAENIRCFYEYKGDDGERSEQDVAES